MEGKRQVSRQHDLFGPSAMALFVGSIAASCALATWFPLMALAVPFVPIALWLWWTFAHVGSGDVRVDGDELVYTLNGKERRFALARIDSAWRGTIVAPHVDATRGRVPIPAEVLAVVVQLRDRSVLRFAVRDEAEATSLLQSMGRDPSTFRASFKGRRVFHSLLFWLAGVPVALAVTALVVRSLAAFTWAHTPPFALGLFAVVALALRALMRPHLDVEVGTNGLLDRSRAFGRFLPWSDVSAVKLGDGAVLFELRDGTRRRLWCNPDDPTVLPAAFARIAEAFAAWRQSAQNRDPLTVLDRNGRTIAQWRADLASLVGHAAGYRVQVIDRARLEAVFADPATPLERRVGAMLALAHDDPAATPTRVRVVAEGNADPLERDLLLRLADGTADDDALEATLHARRAPEIPHRPRFRDTKPP
jgi:hypothetical protein